MTLERSGHRPPSQGDLLAVGGGRCQAFTEYAPPALPPAAETTRWV